MLKLLRSRTLSLSGSDAGAMPLGFGRCRAQVLLPNVTHSCFRVWGDAEIVPCLCKMRTIMSASKQSSCRTKSQIKVVICRKSSQAKQNGLNPSNEARVSSWMRLATFGFYPEPLHQDSGTVSAKSAPSRLTIAYCWLKFN